MYNNRADKGKRKMSGGEDDDDRAGNKRTTFGGEPSNLFRHFAPPTLPLDGHFSQVQQILNAAAPKNPFSYTSFLTTPGDHDANVAHLLNDIYNQRAHIDQMISLHTENLKHALGQHLQDVHRESEERAAKRLKDRESQLLEQNARLQSMADHYKAQAERMVIRVRTLERTTRSLTERLEEANAARFYEEAEQEEGESSFADPNRVEPITLECKVCERKRATVMLWPCRHVCVCTRCEASAMYCPVCDVVKTNGIEVHLPIN